MAAWLGSGTYRKAAWWWAGFRRALADAEEHPHEGPGGNNTGAVVLVHSRHGH